MYCEECGKQITGRGKSRLCQSCSHKGIKHTEETKLKMSENHADFKDKNGPMYGRKHTEETKKKISESNKGKTRNKGKVFSKEHKEKIAKARKGKKHTKAAKRKMSESNKGKKHTKETKRKMSMAHSNPTKETRRKMRIAHTKHIQDNYGNSFPNYNKQACGYFKKFDKLNNTQGRYAIYGDGEYFIKELGYWPDYINFDIKLIMEWDESAHYMNDDLRQKDITRQQEIMEYYPDFEFRRIKEMEKTKWQES